MYGYCLFREIPRDEQGIGKDALARGLQDTYVRVDAWIVQIE